MHMTGARLWEVKDLLNSHHYIGARCADPVHVFAWREAGGLFGDCGVPRAAAVYSSPANRMFIGRTLELSRLARDPNLSRPLSEFVAWTFRWLRKNTDFEYVITYADSDAGHHGGIYQALGLIYLGETSERTKWVNPNTGEQCSGRSFDQRRPQFKIGWKKKRCGHKYLYLKPLNISAHDILKRLGRASLPYPKPKISRAIIRAYSEVA